MMCAYRLSALKLDSDIDLPELMPWDGRTDDGAVAPDGRYRISLTTYDSAGNHAGRSLDVTLIQWLQDLAIWPEPLADLQTEVARH